MKNWKVVRGVLLPGAPNPKKFSCLLLQQSQLKPRELQAFKLLFNNFLTPCGRSVARCPKRFNFMQQRIL